jgi:hypothetical protein
LLSSLSFIIKLSYFAIEIHIYVSNGIAIFEKLLKIFDFTPDPTGFKYSANEAPELGFRVNPPDFELLGKQWEAEAERPNATVVFDNACLFLPKLRSPIPLVKGRTIVYDA